MSIFDLVTSKELSAYWLELTQDRKPFLGENLVFYQGVVYAVEKVLYVEL